VTRYRNRERRSTPFDGGVRAARAVLTLGLGLGVACGTPPPAGERPLELVVPSEIATLDPRFATRGLDVKATRLVHAGLIGLDPASLEPVPLAARGWRWDGPRRLLVELDPQARFHGGAPLTPADVCATLAALADPSLGSPHRVVAESIGRCQAVSPHRVSLELAAPRATLLTDLEVPILRAAEAWSPPCPDGTLDGLGPYQVSASRPGEVRLVPAAHHAGRGARRAAVLRTVRDENARALRLLAGRTDIAPNAIGPALIPALAGREGIELVARPGANVTYLLMHNDREPFDRAQIRHAIARAIDRELLVRTLFAGHAAVADWLLPPGHWATAPDLPRLRYDVASARAALAGERGVTLLTSTDRLRVTVARAIAQMLGDAGLPTRVVSLELGVLLGRLDAGDFDLAVLQLPEVTEPNLLAWFFHPRGIPGAGGQGRNRARYRSVRAAELLDLGGANPDREVRRRAYVALAHEMLRDLPVVPLWHEEQLALLSPRAREFSPSAEGRWLSLCDL